MPFFDIFASPRWSPLRMRTKVVSFFIFFQELSNKKKIKALRPKMTKIASRGGGGPALNVRRFAECTDKIGLYRCFDWANNVKRYLHSWNVSQELTEPMHFAKEKKVGKEKAVKRVSTRVKWLDSETRTSWMTAWKFKHIHNNDSIKTLFCRANFLPDVDKVWNEESFFCLLC